MGLPASAEPASRKHTSPARYPRGCILAYCKTNDDDGEVNNLSVTNPCLLTHLPTHHHPHTTSTSHISSSSQTTTSSYFLGATTTIRRRRGAVVHKAIQKNGNDDIDDIVGDVTPFQPLLLGPHRHRPHRRPPTPPTATTKPATTIDAMSDLPPLPAQPNGTHDHHPSYAEAASHNAPPLSAQPHPDKNLLYTGPSPTRPTTAPDIENKVSVVPHDWAAHPTTETSLHIDVAQSGTDVESDDNEGVNISGSMKRRTRKQRERSDRTYKAKREVKTFWRHFTDRVVHPGPGLIGGTMTLRAPSHSNRYVYIRI